MKRSSLLPLVLVLTLLLVLPARALGVGGPSSYITPTLPLQIRQPSFSVSYHAEGGYSNSISPALNSIPVVPLAYVELWYRSSVDLCTYTPWTLWALDASCAGQTSCNATFAFTAPSQGRYEFYTKAYDQSSGVESKSSADGSTLVDYSDPLIGGTYPLDGAVVSGVVNLGAYFNDSWGLGHVGIWETCY